ncbi:hypothetical protein PHBOTO_002411 [Pseudozyma hubeiensis]|nr:hypothetical protein PHBOTO_002411 [Pseudozyma hubeiensis]
MASLLSSWIGSNKLTADVEQGPSDPARARATSSGSTPMSPIDRATSMTPKAPFQFKSQPDWPFKTPRDHHREASEATLNGRAGEASAPAHPSMTSHPYDGPLVKPSASRPTSMANGSELSHERLTAFSSTLGGVDSEAAWSGAPSEGARSSVPRRRKKIAPPELLVIVKPPPSKQTNPLNLQIQLVMPQQLQSRRDGSQRRSSMDSSVAPADLSATPSTELRRRDSIASTRSAGSELSVSGSVASASSGRRVTPLYNLNFHQILSTTVSDAGTDQKVAKYIKKGIDLDGFGILEPVELINGVNDLATLHKAAPADQASATVQAGNATNISPRSETESSGGAHDNVSAFSAPTHGATSSTVAESTTEPPTSFQAMTPEARGAEANLGGKLLGKFKRFSLGVRPNSTAGTGGTFGRDAAAASTHDRLTAAPTAGAPSLFGRLSTGDVARGQHGNEALQMHPGAGLVDGKRTEGYVWTVRKWNRKALDGAPTNLAGRASALASPLMDAEGSNPVLTNVWKRFNLVNRMGGDEPHPPPSQIPVRFEWSRNSKRLSNRQRYEIARARLRASASLNASAISIDRQTGLEASRSNASLGRHPPQMATTSTSAQSLGVDDAAVPRLSTGDAVRSTSRPSSFISGTGHLSPRRSMDTSAAGSSAPHGDDDVDSGDESDPEDSETPWNCHLVLGPTTRIPLGTLSPAPHHPKLVGQLAVPFPLPDLSSTGLGPDGAGLTREELKDVIIVTCLHLIVRESFGGLARRKSNASVEGGGGGAGLAGAAMANVNGWRLASVPKK